MFYESYVETSIQSVQRVWWMIAIRCLA